MEMLDAIGNLLFSLDQLGGLFLVVPKILDIMFRKTMISKFEHLGVCSCSKAMILSCITVFGVKRLVSLKTQKTEKGI